MYQDLNHILKGEPSLLLSYATSKQFRLIKEKLAVQVKLIRTPHGGLKTKASQQSYHCYTNTGISSLISSWVHADNLYWIHWGRDSLADLPQVHWSATSMPFFLPNVNTGRLRGN